MDESKDSDDHSYPIIYQYDKGQEEDPVFPEGIELVLRDTAKKINGVGRYQLLRHVAFAKRIDQRFKDKANNIVIDIEGKTTKNDQAFKIAGSFTLHKNRFIHLNTDLWIVYFNDPDDLSDKTSINENITSAEPIEADSIETLFTQTEETNEPVQALEISEEIVTWPVIPKIPLPATQKDVEDYLKTLLKEQQAAEVIVATEEIEAPITESIELIAKMKQSRKMRSKETHYIDHPLFGVVIEISLFPKPEEELVEDALNAE